MSHDQLVTHLVNFQVWNYERTGGVYTPTIDRNPLVQHVARPAARVAMPVQYAPEYVPVIPDELLK